MQSDRKCGPTFLPGLDWMLATQWVRSTLGSDGQVLKSVLCCEDKEQRLKKQLIEGGKETKAGWNTEKQGHTKIMRHKTIQKNKSNHRMFNEMQKKKPQKCETPQAPLGRIIAQILQRLVDQSNSSRHFSSEYGKSWKDTVQLLSQRWERKHTWMLTENGCT